MATSAALSIMCRSGRTRSARVKKDAVSITEGLNLTLG
jgi:hypothetical protein